MDKLGLFFFNLILFSLVLADYFEDDKDSDLSESRYTDSENYEEDEYNNTNENEDNEYHDSIIKEDFSFSSEEINSPVKSTNANSEVVAQDEEIRAKDSKSSPIGKQNSLKQIHEANDDMNDHSDEISSEYEVDEFENSLNRIRSILGDIMGQNRADMALEMVRMSKHSPEVVARILYRSMPELKKNQKYFKLAATAIKHSKLLKYILKTAPLHKFGIDNKSPGFEQKVDNLVETLKQHPIVVETITNALENKNLRVYSEKKIANEEIDRRVSSESTGNDKQHRVNREIAAIFLKQAFESLIQQVTSNITNKQCRKQISMFADNLFSTQFKGWALQMLTSSATPKVSPMIRIASMGNYEECLAIRSEPNEDKETVRGKYCLMYSSIVDEAILFDALPFKIALSKQELLEIRNGLSPVNVFVKIRSVFGVCVPAACDEQSLAFIPDNIQKTFNYLIEQHTNYCVRVNIHLNEGMCQSSGDEVAYKSYNIIFIILCVFLLVLLSVSTFLEYFSIKCYSDILSCFSMVANMKKTFSLTLDKRNINSLDGIRVLSMLWIIIGHSYTFEFVNPMVNEMRSYEILNEYTSTFLLMAVFAVDTFFVLSGFLLVFTYFRYLNQGRKIPVFVLYYKRFFRLVPTLAFIILFEINKSMVFDGPMTKWYTHEGEAACIQDWWKILTFINNYKSPLTLCNLQSWFLAVDVQLYILSPILLYGLIKKPKFTIFLSGVAILVSAVSVSILTFLWEVYPLVAGGDKTFRIYHSLECRFSPWLMGGLFGYLMNEFKIYQNKQSSKMVRYLLWIFIFLSITGVFYQLHHRLKKGRSDGIEKSIINGFYRQLWSLVICALIYLCQSDNGGVVNKFLSLAIFKPFSKLNYCIFLDHMIIKLFFASKMTQERYFSNFEVLSRTTVEIVATIALSTILTNAVELPFVNLGEVLLKKISSSKNLKSKNGEKSKKHAKTSVLKKNCAKS